MFLWVGNVVAWLALIVGVLRAVMGVFVVWNPDSPWMAKRYLGSATSGEAINHGLMVALFGIVLGILVTIGKSVTRSR
jgi:hypothetical protein